MTPRVLILIGPPGSGKGTQAELLAIEFGLTHIETSKIIEEKFKNADPTDEVIIKEKEGWIRGKLTNQALVAAWLLEEIEKMGRENRGIIFSGSPRSVIEIEIEIPLLEKFYGKENIGVVNINLSEDECVKRNSGRRICKANRHPIPNFPEYQNIQACPKDGSEILTRLLDKPEIIRERYKVYLNETVPVLDHLDKHGYQIQVVNGDQPIEKVFEDIVEKLKASS